MKNYFKILPLMALAALSSCAVDDTQTNALSYATWPTVFQVQQFTPDYNTTTAVSSIQSNTIVATFSMPVDMNSLANAFTVIEKIDDLPSTDLTPFTTTHTDASGTVVTFNILKQLSNQADYTLNINQGAQSLTGTTLNAPIAMIFNTGGCFLGSNSNLNVVAGAPTIEDVNFVRECKIINGQKVDVAYIDIQFNEDLRSAPLIRLKRFGTGGYNTVPMSQKITGNMSLMTVPVSHPGGRYRVDFPNTFVTDLEGINMAAYNKRNLGQFIVGCD